MQLNPLSAACADLAMLPSPLVPARNSKLAMFSRLTPLWGGLLSSGTASSRSAFMQARSVEAGRRYFTRNSCLNQSSSTAPFNTPQSQKRNASTMCVQVEILGPYTNM